PQRSTLFPYTTLFRSCGGEVSARRRSDQHIHLPETVELGRIERKQIGLNHSGLGMVFLERLRRGMPVVHPPGNAVTGLPESFREDRKSTRLNSSHLVI